MNEMMAFLGIGGEVREIIHVASRVGEGLADVPDEDADKHIKGH